MTQTQSASAPTPGTSNKARWLSGKNPSAPMTGNTPRQLSMRAAIDATLLKGSSHPKRSANPTKTSGETASPPNSTRAAMPSPDGMNLRHSNNARSGRETQVAPAQRAAPTNRVSPSSSNNRTPNRAAASGSTAGPETLNAPPALIATGAIAMAVRWLIRCGTEPYKDRNLS